MFECSQPANKKVLMVDYTSDVGANNEKFSGVHNLFQFPIFFFGLAINNPKGYQLTRF